MRRRGFTLVELLVSMTIIVILVGITAAAVMASANGDRIPGAARQTQSMILGARDRAIYAGEPRGVRLISDPDNAALVTSFVFVGAPQTYGKDRGTATAYQDTSTGEWWIVEDNPMASGWRRLVERQVIMPDLNPRVRIPADSTRWYTIDGVMGPDPSTGAMAFRLTRPYDGAILNDQTYAITLQATPLPGEEPRLLPRGVAIDLPGSNVPGWWIDYPDHRDILFNERGTAYGPLAAQSPLSLLIVDMADYARGFRRGHPNGVATVPDLDGDGSPDVREGDERILTFFPASGTISIAPVDDADADANGVRDDPFRLAESGSEA